MKKLLAALGMSSSGIRTRQFSVQFKFMFVYLLCLKSITQANQIYADNIDHQQKIPLLHERHAVIRTDDGSILRATGFSQSESKFVRFKGTFSLDHCDDNLNEDLFVDAIEASSEQHRFRLSNGTESRHNMDLLISLKSFNFGDNTAAYVCAKWKNGMNFVHMGTNSKFERAAQLDTFLRERRDFFGTTKGDNKCRADEIRIDGMRVESSDKPVSYNEENVPEFISRTKATLRLFGCGFNDQTMITFTQDANNRNDACLIAAAGQFKVRSEGLLEYTAVVDIVVPNAEKSYYYFCVRNADDNEKKLAKTLPFIHQGTEPWLRITSSEMILPLWLAIIIIIGCLCFSALFSGLNLGLMSLDRTELKILRNTGNPREREYARKIQPVRDHGNFLLCSILLGNVLVNSTFTILLDGLTSGLVAVVSSTILIVVFGEITPQAVCSRHGLAVGAKTIVITKAIMLITFPLAYPTSKILDYLLGEEIGNVYNRERLKELVRVTRDINDLDKDEVNIISGALELRKKTVAQVMTHLEDAFMLSIDTVLDFETVSEIMKSGYSRIPVYEGERHNVQKLLLIKDLALIDPDDNTPLRTLCEFYQNNCFFVFEDVTLDVIFKQFKGGQKGHMAFVRRVNNEGDGDPFYETIGLVTLEDVIEEMIQAEIVDETDVYTDNRSKKLRKLWSRKHDFTVFADRKDNHHVRISPQLTMATFQYLSTTIDAFKPDNISETILRRLLNQDVIHQIKCKNKEKTSPSLFIYQQAKPADYFVLLLEGRVEVIVGQENLIFECGPFTYFGTQALVQNVGVESHQQIKGSIQSLNLDAMINHTFMPDYSVRAITDVCYIAFKRTLYLAAKRATLMERSQKYGEPGNNDPIDDEVEKLLHSLDGDDRSINAHTANLNVETPSASQTASPTMITLGNPSNGSAPFIENENSTTVSFIPENQSIQFHSPEKDSQETDALLTPRF